MLYRCSSWVYRGLLSNPGFCIREDMDNTATEMDEDEIEAAKFYTILGYQTRAGILCPTCANKKWGYDNYLGIAKYPKEFDNGSQILPVYACDTVYSDEECPKCHQYIKED